MAITLWDSASGGIGEFGTDLIKAEWRSGNPVTGKIELRGDSPFIAYLMDCAHRPLFVLVTESGHMNGRYRVRRHTYTYHADSGCMSHTDVFRADE